MLKKIKYHRKLFINKLKSLTYMDEKPVEDVDKRYAKAFFEGGMESERAERKKVKEERI